MLEEENDLGLVVEMTHALDLVSRITASISSEELTTIYGQLPFESLSSPLEVDTRPAFLDNIYTPIHIRQEIENSYL